MDRYSAIKEMRFGQVERCLESGMQIRQWCKLNKVPESTFYVWLKIYRAEDASGKEKSNGDWIEVKRQDLKGSKALAIRTEEKDNPAPEQAAQRASGVAVSGDAIRVGINGADILIPAGCDSGTIESVLSTVAAL